MDYLNSVEASYRPELRDLLDAHFGRFDAKHENRTAEIRRELQGEIASLEAKLDQRTAEIRREIAELRGELLVEFHKGIGSVKAELMKWSFLALWVLIALGVIGLYFKGLIP